MLSPLPRHRGGLRWPVGSRALLRFSSSAPHARFFPPAAHLSFTQTTLKDIRRNEGDCRNAADVLHHHATLIDKPCRLSYLPLFGPMRQTSRTWRRRESVASGCIMQASQFSEQSLPHQCAGPSQSLGNMSANNRSSSLAAYTTCADPLHLPSHAVTPAAAFQAGAISSSHHARILALLGGTLGL